MSLEPYQHLFRFFRHGFPLAFSTSSLSWFEDTRFHFQSQAGEGNYVLDLPLDIIFSFCYDSIIAIN